MYYVLRSLGEKTKKTVRNIHFIFSYSPFILLVTLINVILTTTIRAV